MNSLKEIVKAAKHLKPSEFVRLRKQLDRVEQSLWASELSATTRELREGGIDDQQIDRMVVRRRRESRS
jgi:hypothetical protein